MEAVRTKKNRRKKKRRRLNFVNAYKVMTFCCYTIVVTQKLL